jgi:hypothetical protein
MTPRQSIPNVKIEAILHSVNTLPYNSNYKKGGCDGFINSCFFHVSKAALM